MMAKDEEQGIPLMERDPEAQDNSDAKSFQETEPVPDRAATRRKFLIWTAINMAATIGIVFTNKAIFNDPAFKLMQTSFASFHFVCTGLTLWVVSRKSIGAFIPKRAGVVEMLPVLSPPF
jgi:solute carrier family 35 protein E3